MAARSSALDGLEAPDGVSLPRPCQETSLREVVAVQAMQEKQGCEPSQTEEVTTKNTSQWMLVQQRLLG